MYRKIYSHANSIRVLMMMMMIGLGSENTSEHKVIWAKDRTPYPGPRVKSTRAHAQRRYPAQDVSTCFQGRGTQGSRDFPFTSSTTVGYT